MINKNTLQHQPSENFISIKNKLPQSNARTEAKLVDDHESDNLRGEE